MKLTKFSKGQAVFTLDHTDVHHLSSICWIINLLDDVSPELARFCKELSARLGLCSLGATEEVLNQALAEMGLEPDPDLDEP